MTMFSKWPLVACILLYSCGDHANKTAAKATTIVPNTPAPANIKRDTAIEVMNADSMRLNGKLPRYFTVREFQSVLGEPDSSRLLSDEEPCTTIFQEEDGAIDPDARYLYKNGTRYESVQDKVAIDEVRFSDGDFLIFQGTVLNQSTTLNDLKKIFPNAAAHTRTIDVAGEGQLEVMQLREDKDNISDGHINIFLKDGKLFSLHWWFPC